MYSGWLLLILATSVTAPHSTREDPFLIRYAKTRRFANGRPAQVRITPDGKRVLFLRSPPESSVQSLFQLDVDSGKVRELVSAQKILSGHSQELSVEEKARLERQRNFVRGLTGYDLSHDGRTVLFSLQGEPHLYNLETGKLSSLPIPHVLDPRLSPDGKRLAYVQDGELFVYDLAAGKATQLTTGAGPDLTNGLPEFVAQEEMDRFAGYWWSPDSRQLAYEQVDTRKVQRFTIADPMHPEAPVHSFPYPRAGTANAEVRLGVVAVTGGPTRWLDWDRQRYPYLATVRWPEHGPLSVLVQNRHQTEEVLYAAEPEGGSLHPLLVEKDPAWLKLDQAFPFWLEDGSGFLWSTERRGAAEVELRAPDGKLKKVWLDKAAHFAAFVGLDAQRGQLYYLAAPTQPERVVMRSTLGGAPERVSPGQAPAYDAAVLAKQAPTLVITHASDTELSVSTVYADGRRVGELPSVAEAPPFMPQLQIQRVGTGEGLYTFVVRPRSFQPGKKLPVIVYVYGGPGAAVVQDNAAAYLLSQWMADQGFVVVGADNRGTPGRNRNWERAIRGDFADVTLQDQVAALHALAERVPELDLSRVGIWGWSFGGYMSALAVLRRSDVYKVAVAGAPVVDWRDYDTHYTERYLGLPQEDPEAYRKSSLLSYVDGLRSRLLLIHGTADDNVYFFHSLKLSNALLREGKEHDFLPLSGQTHSPQEPQLEARLWHRVLDALREGLEETATASPPR